MIRILTICSQGEEVINQQAQWSGYEEGTVLQVLKDLQVFVNSVNKEKPFLPDEGMTKEERVKALKRQIDSCLEQISKLKN